MFVKIKMDERYISFAKKYISMRDERGLSSKIGLCDSGCVFCESIRANGKTYGKIIYCDGIQYMDDQRDYDFVFGSDCDSDYDFDNYHKCNALYGHVRWSDVVATPKDKVIREAFLTDSEAYGAIWVNKFFGKKGAKDYSKCRNPKAFFFRKEICYNQLLKLAKRYDSAHSHTPIMMYVITVCDAFRDKVINKSQLDGLLDMLSEKLY